VRRTAHVRGPNCSISRFSPRFVDIFEFFFHFLLSTNNFEPEYEEKKPITEAL
jgi:hypothetical protein